jgi:integrase
VENLVTVEPPKEGLAGATKQPISFDVKGKTVEFLWYLKKQGYAESTIQTYYCILKQLVRNSVKIFDPESVKKFIVSQETWGNGRKQNVVKAYSLFLKTQGWTWEKPRYRPVEKLPFIPTENEIDSLIGGCSKQVAVFLQICKETGARRGEAYNLHWIDFDFVSNTVRITPEKGSNPRLFKISNKLQKMLKSLGNRSEERVWQYSCQHNLDKSYRKQRKRIAHKLGNPRLSRITFHTLRHWKATIEYAKTKDILYVQRLLGHKSLKTTLRYTQLMQLPQDEKFICKVAQTVKEATELVEAGFEYVTDIDEHKLFKKRNLTFLGSSTGP